jgi:uncharacterized protein YbjT (DUF2867 family)
VQADHATPTAAPILVTGGSGTLGRQVVGRLRGVGYKVRVLSRHIPDTADGIEWVRGDLATGEGVDAALADAEIVVHLAGSPKGDDVKAGHLVAAASRAAVRHIVFISVVGADRIPMTGAIDRALFGYFGAKHAAERIIGTSGVPWTTLRATQFHDLTFTTVEQLAKLPVIPVPSGFRFQPIDSGEVADRIVELALGVPAGLVADLGGPQPYAMTELVCSYLQATGRRQRPILSLRMPGKAARALRDGANLAPERAVGRRTWADFLDSKVNDGPSQRRR